MMNAYSRILAGSDIALVMDAIAQPAFLVQVHGPAKFTFHHLNQVHQNASGMDARLCLNRSPAELFPPRLAETLTANYERCRATNAPFCYDEHLSLPAGPRWWSTTLSPIHDASGTITFILGIALDISAARAREFELAEKLNQLQALNRQLKGITSMRAMDIRNPLQTILGMLTVIGEGFVDLGDGKFDEMKLCQSIVYDALKQLNSMTKQLDMLTMREDKPNTVDLGHVCRDIIAAMDPDGRFHIRFPDCSIEVEEVALQIVLRLLLEHAARYANERIEIRLGAQKDRLELRICDDGIAPGTGSRCRHDVIAPDGDPDAIPADLLSAAGFIDARGGQLCQSELAQENLVQLSFSLPGKLLSDITTRGGLVVAAG